MHLTAFRVEKSRGTLKSEDVRHFRPNDEKKEVNRTSLLLKFRDCL